MFWIRAVGFVLCGVLWMPVLPAAADDPARDDIRSRTLEKVAFTDDRNQPREVRGCVLIEADDGGLLVLEQDGRLWTVDKPQLKSREATPEKFAPLDPAALEKRLKDELGDRFQTVTTKHYVIVSDTGKPYAEWCGSLFERLYANFHNFWTQRGLELREPDFPLIALVFANQREFAEFATKDAGPDTASAKGYFYITSNRMVLFDLTAGERNRAATTPADIARRLQAAPFNVATIIHEATHQIAFNCGLHTRLADNPLWFSEGMAMFFETPDLTSKTGWKTIGAVNPLRHRQFLALLKNRPAGSLQTLLQDDKRLTDPVAYGDAYAEAWALTHFLIKTRKTQYVEYLQQLASKPRLEWDTPEKRLAEFKAAFGEDLGTLDAEMIRFIRRAK